MVCAVNHQLIFGSTSLIIINKVALSSCLDNRQRKKLVIEGIKHPKTVLDELNILLEFDLVNEIQYTHGYYFFIYIRKIIIS